MRKISLLTLLLFLLFTCITPKKEVDLLVHNATIYTVDEALPKTSAFVISNGKFVAIGDLLELQEKYTPRKNIDATGKTILPGLIDAHCHFYRLLL